MALLRHQLPTVLRHLALTVKVTRTRKTFLESTLLVSGLYHVFCVLYTAQRELFPRDFLLKPELRRAISDLGFEHPSEGKF